MTHSNLASLTLTETTTNAATKRAQGPYNSQANVLRQLALIWNTMSGTDKSTWQNLCQQMSQPLVAGKQPRVSAYSTFVAMGSIAHATSGEIPTTAPATLETAPMLPSLSLTATLSGTDLSLALTVSDAYPHFVLIGGARPLLAGQPIANSQAFKTISIAPSLVAETLDLASAYTRLYRIPSVGYQIALRFTGATAAGFRTIPTLLTATVTAP